jgi:zinc finger protein 830
MAEVRSLLRSERVSRRISHPLATYSASGSLTCTACSLQIKSESLWEGHLRSPKHIALVSQAAPAKASEDHPHKKRKAGHKVDEDNGDDGTRKKLRGTRPEDHTDAAEASSAEPKAEPQTVDQPMISVSVDEDEWAAFQADIAESTIERAALDAVISAPAMTTAEVAAKSQEEEAAARKARMEAELEGEKEDAARKLEVELGDMEELEERLTALKRKRDTLRVKAMALPAKPAPEIEEGLDASTISDEDEDDDDDWRAFRMRA